MSVKILVTALGQQIIADVKSVSNKETGEVLAYWVKHPRVVAYRALEEGGLSVDFVDYCPVASSLEFSIASHHVVSILDAREEVIERYQEVVTPAPEVAAEEAPAEAAETEVVEEAAE